MSRLDARTAAPRLPGWLRSKWFRALVSIAILGFVLTRLDLGQLGDTLVQVAPGLLLAGTVLFLIDNMISVYKWRLILQAQGSPAPYFYLTSLFYIGLFFNNFLPTNFGGDVVRAFKLGRVTRQPVTAASSVVVDRASSTFALVLIAIVPALTQLRLLGTRMALVIAAMFVAFLLAIGLVASERTARRLGALSSWDPLGMRRHLRSFYMSLHDYGRNRAALAWVLAISLVYQGVQVLTTYFFALSLGIHVDILYFFIFIPLVLVVGMIPFSLNGLGLREGAWVLLFGQVGVSSVAAFSMSILTSIVLLAVSLAGGVFYLFDRSIPEGAPPGQGAAAEAAESGGAMAAGDVAEGARPMPEPQGEAGNGR